MYPKSGVKQCCVWSSTASSNALANVPGGRGNVLFQSKEDPLMQAGALCYFCVTSMGMGVRPTRSQRLCGQSERLRILAQLASLSHWNVPTEQTLASWLRFLLHATYWENVDGILREGMNLEQAQLNSCVACLKSEVRSCVTEVNVYCIG